jgi:hypothetical protein
MLQMPLFERKSFEINVKIHLYAIYVDLKYFQCARSHLEVNHHMKFLMFEELLVDVSLINLLEILESFSEVSISITEIVYSLFASAKIIHSYLYSGRTIFLVFRC